LARGLTYPLPLAMLEHDHGPLRDAALAATPEAVPTKSAIVAR